jgi:MFS family permease
MAPGFVLNSVVKIFGRWVNVVSLVVMGVGLLLMSLHHPTAVSLICGAILTGLGYGVMQPIIYDKTAILAPPEKATKALSVVMAVNYVAVVVCPFVVDFAKELFRQKTESFPFVASAVLVAMVALLSLLLRKSFVLGLDESYYRNKK